jgi:hypothetical protein
MACYQSSGGGLKQVADKFEVGTNADTFPHFTYYLTFA